MKNTKKIITIIMMATIICSIFVACSKNNDEPVDNTISVSDTVKESAENNTKENEIVENTAENTVENTEEQTEKEEKTSEAVTKQENTTNKKETTTAKKQENTTKKKVETTTKKKVETTTKKKAETTTKKKVTTTKKAVTTTKKAVKNVTVAEVQSQLNAYLKSKGFTIDSSLRPNNSSWRGEISCLQEYLNSGSTLKHGKGAADLAYRECINSGYKAKEVAAYCYYGNATENGKAIYILYLPGAGVFD